MLLLYLVSHPIQYQAPLLRRIAAEDGIDLQVLFESMETAGVYRDSGFAADVAWDVPLTDGYEHDAVASFRQLREAIADADVVWMHGWDSVVKLRALAAARRSATPVLMRGENTLTAMPDSGYPRRVAKRRYLNWIFERCAGFLCIGSENRAYYAAHGVEAARLFDMPYAVDNDFFRRGEGDLRRELELQPGRPIILYAGKFMARKHPLTLLAAFNALDKEAARNPYLIFVGDGEQRPHLMRAAEGNDAVRVLGFKNQRELPAYYCLADVFVLASEREPWGLAVNEAMNGGCAIVVSDQCGCAADLVDETCGAVVPAADVGALSRALADVMSSPERTASLAAAAKARIAGWNFEADISGLRQALRTVCPTPPPA